MKFALIVLLLSLAGCFASGCGKKESGASVPNANGTAARPHEHKTPHGGTAVVLGAETYHLELVLDPVAGKLSAFVLDGEMDNFIRLSAPSFEVVVTSGGDPQTLLFRAVGDAATGEKPGDTALFEASAEWLRNTPAFDAVLTRIEIRGTTFASVRFNFPNGNDQK